MTLHQSNPVFHHFYAHICRETRTEKPCTLLDCTVTNHTKLFTETEFPNKNYLIFDTLSKFVKLQE